MIVINDDHKISVFLRLIQYTLHSLFHMSRYAVCAFLCV